MGEELSETIANQLNMQNSYGIDILTVKATTFTKERSKSKTIFMFSAKIPASFSPTFPS